MINKLIEFIGSFKDLNLKELIFRELDLLPYLVGALILVVLLKWLINRKSRGRASLGVSSLAFFKSRKSIWRRLPEVLFVFAIIFLILVLLNPVLPLVKNQKNIKAKEIMIVLDLSGSMTYVWGGYWNAKGYVGSGDESILKIHISIKHLAKFIESREDDALGLIVYSNNAYLTSPLNYQDHQSLISLIKLFAADVKNSTDELIKGEGSTATGDALFLAHEYLKQYGQNKERIIVLLTDGESNIGSYPNFAFFEIRKSGFKVFILGIDYYEATIMAQQIAREARETNGDFFNADTEAELERAVEEIDRRVGDNIMTVDEYAVDEPQYVHFAFIALVLFIIALVLKHLHFFRDLL